MWPKIWGSFYWSFIHRCTLRNMTRPQLDAFRSFLIHIIGVLPCPACRYHANRYLVTHPIAQFSTTQEAFEYSVDLHNEVNARSGKRSIGYTEARTLHLTILSTTYPTIPSDQVMIMEDWYILLLTCYVYTQNPQTATTEEQTVFYNIVENFIIIAPFGSALCDEDTSSVTLTDQLLEYLHDFSPRCNKRAVAISLVVDLINVAYLHNVHTRVMPRTEQEILSVFMDAMNSADVKKLLFDELMHRRNAEHIKTLEHNQWSSHVWYLLCISLLICGILLCSLKMRSSS